MAVPIFLWFLIVHDSLPLRDRASNETDPLCSPVGGTIFGGGLRDVVAAVVSGSY